MTSIIERDIDFYTAMAEQHRTELRRCTSGDEPKYRERIQLAVAVYQALLNYKARVEQPLKWTPETARQRVGGTFGT